MDKIEVRILDHNLYTNFPLFLAKLTQRGHEITCLKDLEKMWLKDAKESGPPKEYLLCLPHTTILRMNYVTVAITGLSTKGLTQLRTHAKRATCISTSTQYSEYSGRKNNYVIPSGLTTEQREQFTIGYQKVQEVYNDLIAQGVDKDKVGYLLPQGLRKAFIMSANIDDWGYILRTRLCRRNTEEVQFICRRIYEEIKAINKEWVAMCLPNCARGKGCPEGKFCCGNPLKEADFYDY